MSEPDGATPLDPDESDGLLFPNIATRGQLNNVEQINIQDGMRWLARRKKVDVLTDEFVRELHKKLFGEVWRWAGTFRKTEKNIGVAPHNISTDLRVLLDDVRYWLDNDTYGTRECAVRLHHRIVKIHCFPNGNGRHSRIMADALLTKIRGEAEINWVAPSGGLNNNSQHRKNYLEALRAADRGDYLHLFRFTGVKPRM